MREHGPQFSLIVGSLNRTAELAEFLAGLANQTYTGFQLIIVDQNSDDRLVPFVSRYRSRFSVQHLRCEPGLSRARNVGLRHAIGDIIGFPDDDCVYPPDLLLRVAEFFAANAGYRGLAGATSDKEGRASALPADLHRGDLDRWNVWRRAISFAVFLRRETVARVGDFDTQLGVGAGTPWGSAEETDYLLRAMELGERLYYDPSIVVYHPNPIQVVTSGSLVRAKSYSRGMGRVLSTHRYPFWYVGYFLLRPLGGALLALAGGSSLRARYHLSVATGRVDGWWCNR
jgi:glycosyltransferase involved in cell wall biosynthesis